MMSRSVLAALVLVVVSGCNNPGLAPVSGRVMLDGQPLAGIAVYFQPVGDRYNPGMGSVGITDEDGYYVLYQIQPRRLGAVVGMHRVTLRPAPIPNGETSAPADKLIELLKLLDADDRRPVPVGGAPNMDFHLNSTRQS